MTAVVTFSVVVIGVTQSYITSVFKVQRYYMVVFHTFFQQKIAEKGHQKVRFSASADSCNDLYHTVFATGNQAVKV